MVSPSTSVEATKYFFLLISSNVFLIDGATFAIALDAADCTFSAPLIVLSISLITSLRDLIKTGSESFGFCFSAFFLASFNFSIEVNKSLLGISPTLN